jgi:ribosomal-protein-alanine N-acetyltransferase
MLPNLFTERLHIRPYAANEAPQRNELARQAFDIELPMQATRDWLEWTRLSYTHFANLDQPPYGDYAVALREGTTVVGSVGIVPSVVPWSVFERQPENDFDYTTAPEFGMFWAVLPAYQKRGYATEAARALAQHIFDVLCPKRIVATTESDNHASIAVMRHIGMTIQHNPYNVPFWFQVLGVLNRSDEASSSGE